MSTQDQAATVAGAKPSAPPAVADVARVVPSQRIAAIDWMRGFVMILMVIDHVSMAFDGHHLTIDSAMIPGASTAALPTGEFLTRWITHLCAPTFVFLAGTSLALSVERRVERGVDAWEIDRNILIRGFLIAILDPTIVSLGSGRWTFQVLFAIGVCMMLMAPLRRLPSWLLSALAVGWILFGEIPTGWVWHPPGSSSIPAALTIATYGGTDLVIKYPVIPWLSAMMLGWVFGRHLVHYASGRSKVSGKTVLWAAGVAGLLVFFAVRYLELYGDMFLTRSDDSWQRWLQVSKYPPSLSYMGLELGMLAIGLALLRTLEEHTQPNRNGVLLVFGETAMFFYIVHRLVLEVPATYFGLRGVGGLATTYIVAALLLAALYPACRWYRGFKARHRDSILKYY